MAASAACADCVSIGLEESLPLKLKNRLVKAAMVEGLASIRAGLPNNLHYRLYRRWAEGGYGMLITGNVIIDACHSGTPGDLRLPASSTKSDLDAWRALAVAMSSNNTVSIMQLVHCGRQSVRCAGRWPWVRPMAPSAIRVQTRETSWISQLVARVVFQKPREMDENDIVKVKQQFLRGAKLAQDAGFHGIELHASHGYLLSSFISPRSNLRKDRYGGTPENRLRLLLEIIEEVRKECPTPFIIGVKLNSADYMEGGLTEEEALLHIRQLTRQGMLDFIEISGGSYESLAFLDASASSSNRSADSAEKDEQKAYSSSSHRSERTMRREAVFSAFCSHAREAVEGQLASSAGRTSRRPLIMCTGGFKTLAGMNAAVQNDGIDLIGVGRAAAVDPDLPNRLLGIGKSRKDSDKPSDECVEYEMSGGAWLKKLVPLQLVGGGMTTLWHQGQMKLFAEGGEPQLNRSLESLVAEDVWSGIDSVGKAFIGFVVASLAVAITRLL